MKKTILLASAMLAFVIPAATPLAAAAQQRGQDRDEARGRNHQSSRERPERPAASSQRQARSDRQEQRQERREQRPEARPQAAPQQRQEQRQDRRAQRQERREDRREARPQQQRPQGATPRPDRVRPEGVRPQRRPDGPRADQRQDRREDRWENRQDRRGDRQDRRQDRREDRWERREDRRDYREFRNRWNRDVWRRSFYNNRRHDWWRNDHRFRGYSGVRIGFYFAPSYGYYSVPRQYWGQRYSEGQYLPDVFWRYQLNDWRTYGLGAPPVGARWVSVDNHIYLIDEYDGYIIEVVSDVWRW